MTAGVMAVSAPAKINLHLQVMGTRSGGYHELRTLYQSIDFADEVRGSTSSGGNIDLKVQPESAVDAGDGNLVFRAATALREWTGITTGAHLELRKRIPVGAGLGGGSADAAATLVLLDALWELNLEPGALRHIAAGLGADVPFFLCGGLALGVGRGDEVYPLPDLEKFSVVVSFPETEIPTAEVYSRLGRRLTSSGVDATVYAFVADRTEDGRGTPPWSSFFNDLEPVVVQGWPEIDRGLQAIRATHPLHSAVTGAGAAVFGVYPDAGAALQAAEDLGDNWRFHVGSTLGRAESKLVARYVESRGEDRE